jgi:hypothetical protein
MPAFLPPQIPALHAPELAQTIQLAITPVFLLTAIGAFLSVMTTRLGRAIDRARTLEGNVPEAGPERADVVAQLAVLDRRIQLANRAVNFSVLAAFTTCLLIGALFIASFTTLPGQLMPLMFLVTILLLLAALASFLLEVRIATRTVRVRAELIMGAPTPPGDLHLPL